jgi:ABC-type uncharacterized transport system substrate-binding protein
MARERRSAWPGGNITGTWFLGDEALAVKGLDFLKLAVPGLARVGAMFNPDDPVDRVQIPRLSAATHPAGLDIELIQFRDLSNFDAVADKIMHANVQGLFVGMSPFYMVARTGIAAMVARLKLPAVYGWREFSDAGGLLSYGPNLPRCIASQPDWWLEFSRVQSRPICHLSCRPATN